MIKASDSAQFGIREQRLRSRAAKLLSAPTTLLEESLWTQLNGAQALATPTLSRCCMELIALGEPFLAYELSLLGASHSEQPLAPVRALALAHAGSSEAALNLLNSSSDNPESLTIKGRIYKHIYVSARTPKQQLAALEESFRCYNQAYAITRGIYPAINAACIAALLGKWPKAEELARAAIARCEVEEDPAGRIWREATMAEAFLILKEIALSRKHYARAFELAGRRLGVKASILRNASLLLESLGTVRSEFAEVLEPFKIGVFAGHMVDRFDRSSPRFPRGRVPAAKERLARMVQEARIRVGIASAACGGDILFLEAVLENGGEIHLVYPCSEETFRKESVTVNDDEWLSRYHHVLENASSVLFASEHPYSENPIAFEHASRLLYGLGKLKALSFGVPLRALALWDGGPSGGVGGTADIVEAWRRAGESVSVLHPAGDSPSDFEPLSGTPCYKLSNPTHKNLQAPAQVIRAILFADVVGYSSLTEIEIPLFLSHFMGSLGALAKKSPNRPEVYNTWGDGIYMIFEPTQKAAAFAFELQEFVHSTPWRKLGLSRDLLLRVGLHAGPVFSYIDPLTGAQSYTGTHVSRAARVEPITAEGQVFATEGFVGLAAAEGPLPFHAGFIGEQMLPKAAGFVRLYQLTPKRD